MSERNDHELAEFERQLTQFVPHRSNVDRETLLFRAGQESMLAKTRPSSRASWLWPLTTAAMTIISAGLSWQLYVRGEPSVVERVRIVERSVPTREAETPPDSEPVDNLRSVYADTTYVRDAPMIPRDHYLLRRELALTVGMDALTVPVAFHAQEPIDVSSYRELRSTYTESSSRGGENRTEEESMSNSRYLGDKS